MIIYCVDDEKYALDFLNRAVKEALPNENPICFRHSEDLLNESKKTPPDIVFLDIQMPGLTGIEVAKRINEISEKTNIIFVTGFGEYTSDAFDVLASGYIMKPCTSEAITKVLSKLNLKEKEKPIFIKTFGNFDVMNNGISVKFRSAKSKELLAYLVDREGTFVSRGEAIAVLFEEDDENNASIRLSQYAKRLSEDLESAGIIGLFISDNGFQLNLDNVECDLIEYMSGNTKYKYCGEYMEQYSFGEFKKSTLYEIK